MKCIYSSVYGQNFSGDVFRIIKSRMEPVLPEVKHPLLNIMLRSYYKTLYERDRTSGFAHIKYDMVGELLLPGRRQCFPGTPDRSRT